MAKDGKGVGKRRIATKDIGNKNFTLDAKGAHDGEMPRIGSKMQSKKGKMK